MNDSLKIGIFFSLIFLFVPLSKLSGQSYAEEKKECVCPKIEIKKPKPLITEKKTEKPKMDPYEKNAMRSKWYFITKVMPTIRKEECGKCDTLCHIDKNVSGGLTCQGIAYNHNRKWYLEKLNSFDKNCNPTAAPAGGISCNTNLFVYDAKLLLWQKYAKQFRFCSVKAFAMIVDSAVLSGPANAAKHLQKISKIKVDGIMGKQSYAKCQDDTFQPEKYTEARIDRFKTLKKCKLYCKGWIKRAKRKLKEYKEG